MVNRIKNIIGSKTSKHISIIRKLKEAQRMQETPEPLAKYPTKVMVQGRITLLTPIREYYNIELGDFIEVIIRKKDNEKVHRGHFLARVYDKGYMTIPKGLRDEIGIKPGDFVEVLIVDIIKPEELLGDKAKFLRNILRGKYEIITRDQEIRILSRA
ncbi:AbrB/MazE/SpoVT family DNA-binding domain-containing protein [Thermococcus chitonophagus]|nr:AbrB/MazE/SpoVT family DNA-binding domain-containing protein [Thermococcus chitonophagus]